MFRGSFEHTVDDKGRVSVPAKFRDRITAANDDRVVITNFQFTTLRCLDVYPYPAWVRLEERVLQQPQFDLRVQHIYQYYFAEAQDQQLDKQGRILLPPTLREYANLRRDVVFVGQGEKFQIWDRDARKQVHSRAESAVFEDPNFFRDLGV